MSVLEWLLDRLENPAIQMCSDDLAYIQFKMDAEKLERFTSVPQNKALLLKWYPNGGNLWDAALDMIDNLKILHTVRNRILEPHLRADGQDIVREQLRHWDIQVRAEMNGLTVEQQQALEANLDNKGFVILTTAERQELAAEIRDALDGDPNT